MKGLSKLQKLQIKRDFHAEYHRGPISDIILQGLKELIEKEEKLTLTKGLGKT